MKAITIVVIMALLLLAACTTPGPGPQPQPVLGPTPTTGPTPIPPTTALLGETSLGQRTTLDYKGIKFTFALGSDVDEGMTYRVSGGAEGIGSDSKKCGPVTPCQVTLQVGNTEFQGRVEFPPGRRPAGQPHLYVYAP